MMKIGQIETDGIPGRRDAFHVPAVLVTCDQEIVPGDGVRFVDDTFTLVKPALSGARHGIVDPFLLKNAGRGQKFWVLLMPGMIKDKLTHQFDLNIPDVPHKKTQEEEDAEYEDQCKGCW